uniref:Uncharacterized protein n=1 Tax=Rhizophora mucronata TaxID=61149 RepID=A0A2P2N8A7_RHIMU
MCCCHAQTCRPGYACAFCISFFFIYKCIFGLIGIGYAVTQ